MMYFFFQRLLLCCLAPPPTPPPLQQIVAAGFCFSSFNILFLFLFVFLYVVLHITFLLNKIIPSVGYKFPKKPNIQYTIYIAIPPSFYLFILLFMHFISFHCHIFNHFDGLIFFNYIFFFFIHMFFSQNTCVLSHCLYQ